MSICSICGGDSWGSGYCEDCGKFTKRQIGKPSFKPLTDRELGLDGKEKPCEMRSAETRRHKKWLEDHE